MVTYIVPAVGLLLGVIFLGEKMDAYIIVGAGLIFAAIGIVNIRFGRKQKIQPQIEASDSKTATAAAGD
jgi:drug/metabolite transporter (DMT)-like permease